MTEPYDLHVGDCRAVLATLPAASVQTVVTSPPYFGLRDYGHDGQIGLEPTPDEYVRALVSVFREVRRVLRDDGTVWLNLGDSYAGSGPSGAAYQSDTTKRRAEGGGMDGAFRVSKRLAERGLTYADKKPIPPPGLKHKDLVGIPWRVAFALQADGWYLRSDIIWHKPNPMPESVTDRPTKSHEYIFLLTKSERYYYDHAAIAEPSAGLGATSIRGGGSKYGDNCDPLYATKSGNAYTDTGTRNKRTVWTVATQPYADAHFATYPPELIRPCILAGSLPVGAPEPDDIIRTPAGEGEREPDPSLVTGRAGMNRPRRDAEAVRPISRAEQGAYAEQLRLSPHRASMEAAAGPTAFAYYTRTDVSGARPIPPNLLGNWIERGWVTRVSIPPRLADPSRSTVLDPFNDAGTTGLVAMQHGRRYIGIELNPEYAALTRDRLAATAAQPTLFASAP